MMTPIAGSGACGIAINRPPPHTMIVERCRLLICDDLVPLLVLFLLSGAIMGAAASW